MQYSTMDDVYFVLVLTFLFIILLSARIKKVTGWKACYITKNF